MGVFTSDIIIALIEYLIIVFLGILIAVNIMPALEKEAEFNRQRMAEFHYQQEVKNWKE